MGRVAKHSASGRWETAKQTLWLDQKRLDAVLSIIEYRVS